MDDPDLRQDQPCPHHSQPLLTSNKQCKELTASAKEAAFKGVRALLEQLPRAQGTGQAQDTHTRTSASSSRTAFFISPSEFA